MKLSAFGPFRGCTGYDYVFRGFLKEWYRQGHQVQLYEFTRWSNLRAPTEIDSILDEMEKTNLPNVDVHVNFCLLDQGQLNPNAMNVIYTMFESSSICKLWVECAKKFDMIFVPTEFNLESFAKSGVPEHKIHVCPPPHDINHILGPKPELNILPYGEKEFITRYKSRFLNCSEFIGRKNIECLLASWAAETKVTDDACLIIKLNSNSGLKLDHLKSRLDSFLANKKCAPIYLLVDYLTDSQMLSLYNSCTHYVTSSFGEGWGLSESICGILGKKIVAPNSSAFKCYLNKDNSYPVGTNTVGANQDGPTARYYAGSQWYPPIQFMLKKQIRAAIGDEVAGDFSKNKKVQEDLVHKTESFSVANYMLNAIKNYTPTVKNFIKIELNEQKNNYNWMMICKSLGSKCGIADYTMSLTDGMRTHKDKLFSDFLIVNGDSLEYGGIIDDVASKVHVCNLQLEYQFIPPKRLELFIKYCDANNVIPVVTMHTVNPRAFDYHEVLKKTGCNIIVSSEKMKTTLVSECGFDPLLIKVIPMGISTQNIMGSTSKNERFKIGFFGFTYFHKGIDRLIQYMNKFGYDKEALILSTKPDNDTGYFDKMIKSFSELGVNSSWIPDYLDESQIVTNLASCDLIFLPYAEYGGVGVSAAIRTALKAGVPIAALNNSFFSDVVADSNLIDFVGNDPDDFFDWAMRLEELIKGMSVVGVGEVKKKFIEKRDNFIQNYNWNKVGALYLSHFSELLHENSKK